MLLRGTRVYLRDLRPTDAASIHTMTENEEIRYLTGTKNRFTQQSIEQHILLWKNDPSRMDFAICLMETDEMIGDIALFHIDESNKNAAFRIAMHDMALTGKGYGPEAIDILMHYVFNHLKLHRLQLEVYSHNERGIRAYKKLGFKKEGVLRDALYYNGEFMDEMIMSILESEFREAKML